MVPPASRTPRRFEARTLSKFPEIPTSVARTAGTAAGIQHPFYDPVEYNITAQLPAGWVLDPVYQNLTLSSPGSRTITFNLNSSQSNENVTINITAN